MSIMYERILRLCTLKGIKPGRICSETGLSRGMMTDLKMGRTKTLSAKNAKIVADYLGVSVDYLIGEAEEGNETEKTPTVSGERDILDEIDVAFYGDFKELSEDDKETLRAMARVMRERRAAQQDK